MTVNNLDNPVCLVRRDQILHMDKWDKSLVSTVEFGIEVRYFENHLFGIQILICNVFSACLYIDDCGLSLTFKTPGKLRAAELHGRLLLPVEELHVGAVADQQPRHLPPLLLASGVQRGVTIPVAWST